jgi:hypothetical protein
MGKASKYISIGTITEKIAKTKNFKYPGKVYAAPGIIKHIQKHKDKFSQTISNDLLTTMENILDKPDYVGCAPDKEGTSLELIKKIGDNMLLALQFDTTDNYIYVASLYPITEAKLNNRLNSKRIVKV